MSTITTIPGAASAQQQRPMSSAASSAPAATSTIDPVKLLIKYAWVLGVAAVIGAVTGAGLHFALKRVAPVWASAALFQCSQPSDDPTRPNSHPISTEEMNRFMLTQVRIMTSEDILRKVAEDPAIQNAAPLWFATYAKDGVIDSTRAVRDLRADVSARMVGGTNLIELSMKWRDKVDATAVVGAVRQKYMAQVNEASRIFMEGSTSAIRARLADLDREAATLGAQKENLIQTRGLDSIDNRIESKRNEAAETFGRLVEVRQNLRARETMFRQMEAELQNPGGVAYTDDLREEVETLPVILDIRRDLQNLQNSLQSLIQAGTSKEHRQYLTLEANIRAVEQNLNAKRDEELKKRFGSQLDQARKSIDALKAQEATLDQQNRDANLALVDLSKAQSQLNDMENKLQGVIRARSELNADLQRLLANSQLAGITRVELLQPERIPNQLSFPQLKMMVPGGTVLLLGLTAGVIFIRELIDQRVKGPSDVTIIPRARLAGWVPDAAEDPAGQGAVETAFRDRPRGVVAESFRQVRGVVSKRMQPGDHRTLLVMSGMPTAGATTVATNLGLAFAAADKKVLLVDANFRRPSIHRVFGLGETPGLADVLANQAELAKAVQASSSPNLDVLTAGSKEHRVFERLAGEGVGALLAQCRAMYDLIIIDVAPAVVAGDAMALAHRVDASLLVVRAMADKRGMVARIRNDLADTRSDLLGIVVNGVQSASGGYMKRNIQTAHEYHND